MKTKITIAGLFFGMWALHGQDTLKIHNLGHASLMFEYNNLIIHFDPRGQEADYANLPDADFVFVTHSHGDHYDVNALNNIKKDSTILITTQEVADIGSYSGRIEIMANNDTNEFEGIKIKAVPAYNTTKSFHQKGVGNGYILSFGNKEVYVAGDTEDVPEMSDLDVDIAFLPMNQPYTMTKEQLELASLMVKPEILYVYHFSGSDTAAARSIMAKHDSIEVRIGESLYYYNTVTGESKKIVMESPEEPEEPEVPSDVRMNSDNSSVLYPNPVNNSMRVNNVLPGSEMKIVNLKGEILMEQTVSSTMLEINTSTFSPGTYFMKITSPNGKIKQFKFITTN